MSIFAVTADYDVQFNNYAVPIGLISVFANRSFAETSSLTIDLKYWSLNQPYYKKKTIFWLNSGDMLHVTCTFITFWCGDFLLSKYWKLFNGSNNIIFFTVKKFLAFKTSKIFRINYFITLQVLISLSNQIYFIEFRVTW